MKKSDPPIILEKSFSVNKEVLWNALTNREEMIQWFFENIEVFIPEAGFKTQFAVHVEDRTFTHLWQVTEVEPGKRITYNWKYKEYPGDSFAAFELIETGDQVTLRLTLTIVEDFPQNIAEFKRESCIGGWNYFLGESLRQYLEKQLL